MQSKECSARPSLSSQAIINHFKSTRSPRSGVALVSLSQSVTGGKQPIGSVVLYKWYSGFQNMRPWCHYSWRSLRHILMPATLYKIKDCVLPLLTELSIMSDTDDVKDILGQWMSWINKRMNNLAQDHIGGSTEFGNQFSQFWIISATTAFIYAHYILLSLRLWTRNIKINYVPLTGPLRPSVTYCPNILPLAQFFPSHLTKIKVYHHHAEEVMLSALPPSRYIRYTKCNLFSSREVTKVREKTEAGALPERLRVGINSALSANVL